MGASLFIFFISILVEPVWAGGPIHGARAAGMGSAYIGVAEGPSAIAHNPAGLTQGEGTRLYGGVAVLTIDTEYEDPSGNTEGTETQFFFPPHLYVVSDFNTDNFDFGIGFHSIFGIGGRKWDREGLTRYQATEDNITTFTINPTMAWEIAPWISVGFGADLMYARIDSERMIDQSAVSAQDARTNFEADGLGWGYNAGILVKMNESVRLGFHYRSKIDVDYDGEMKITGIAPALQPAFGGSSFSTDVTTSSTFPEIYGVGLSYKRNKLTAAFDVELVRWSSFDREKVDLKNEVPAAGVTDGEQVFDWKDAWQYKLGIEYRATGKLSLRTGYAYIKSPVPERTLGPGNPDSDQHNFSVGGGYRFDPWLIDAFYQIALFEQQTVNNDILGGKYNTIIHYGGISLGYHF